jgi:hypothetical protein
VWETRDAGAPWQPIFDDQPIGSIGALAVAPSNPKVIYVGSGESTCAPTSRRGTGCTARAMAARTWSHIGLADSQQIARIASTPPIRISSTSRRSGIRTARTPSAVCSARATAAARGSASSAATGDSDTGAVDVAFEPGNPNVLYAALWQTRRTPWSVYPPSNGPGSGCSNRSNGGDTWTEIRGHGFPEKPDGSASPCAPSNPRRVYAIVDAPEGGMYRSDDGGANWTRTSKDPRIWSRGWYFGEIAVEPDNADVVYSCNVNLYRSDDGGKRSRPSAAARRRRLSRALDRSTNSRAPHPRRRSGRGDLRQRRENVELLVQPAHGAVISCQHGQQLSLSPVTARSRNRARPACPGRTNTIDGISMMNFARPTAGGESDNVVADSNDPDVIYGGRVDRLDLKTQQTRSVDPTLAHPENVAARGRLPLVFSVRDPHVLYFANQRLSPHGTGGEQWTVISPDLTREDPGRRRISIRPRRRCTNRPARVAV